MSDNSDGEDDNDEPEPEKKLSIKKHHQESKWLNLMDSISMKRWAKLKSKFDSMGRKQITKQNEITKQ